MWLAFDSMFEFKHLLRKLLIFKNNILTLKTTNFQKTLNQASSKLNWDMKWQDLTHLLLSPSHIEIFMVFQIRPTETTIKCCGKDVSYFSKWIANKQIFIIQMPFLSDLKHKVAWTWPFACWIVLRKISKWHFKISNLLVSGKPFIWKYY